MVTKEPEDEDELVSKGMVGRVLCHIDDGRYLVSFLNLEGPRILDGSLLTYQQKVKRIQYVCVCGQKANLMCIRCQVRWYCSKSCQEEDYPNHREGCKSLGSGETLVDRMRKGDSMLAGYEEQDSDEENEY